jgi:inhibitor of KinA sporulation pathway (predicted exonuclease)
MNYIIVDLEATCEKDNKAFQNEIIEIGAVKMSQTPQVLDRFSSFVKPTLNPILSDFCKELTSITQEDIDKADSFPLVLQKFVDWVGKEPYVICSWGYYDKQQFMKDCYLHGISADWIKNRHISLKHQHAEKILGQPDKPVGMAKALKIAKLPLEGIHHRGIDDATNISKIFIHYYDKWDISNINKSSEN